MAKDPKAHIRIGEIGDARREAERTLVVLLTDAVWNWPDKTLRVTIEPVE